MRAHLRLLFAASAAVQDGAGIYTVVRAVRAGMPTQLELHAFEAAYITTGAPLPPGADAVVALESVTVVEAGGERAVNVVGMKRASVDAAGATRVRLSRPVPAGHEVRAIGSDIAAGSTLVPAGARVR